MTFERMIELLEIEKECVLRNASGECNRYCAGCDLLQDDTELHEMYTEAIALLKAQEPCEDAVSRKDVINVLQSPCDMRYINGNWHPCIGDYIEAITNLPAVAPKAQEPVVPIRMNHDRNKYRDHYKCPICDDDLTYEQQYCAECGRSVKWE